MSEIFIKARVYDFVASYALRRGVSSRDLTEYLNPSIEPSEYFLVDSPEVQERLCKAETNNESVTVVADHGIDGVCAAAILYRYFRECTKLKPETWFVDGVVFGPGEAQKFAVKCKASLCIFLGHGTNSREVIDALNQAGVDVIIVDNQAPREPVEDVVALINPKAHSFECGDWTELCTASLVLFLCDYLFMCQYIEGTGEPQWDNATATMLAGVATFGTGVALTGTNRAIAKNGLNLINRPELTRNCGLHALKCNSEKRLGQSDVESEILTKLTALGPEMSLELLTTQSQHTAGWMAELHADKFKAMTAKTQAMFAQAVSQVRADIAKPQKQRVLVLANPDWQIQLVNLIAGRLVERLGRSVVMLGLDAEYNWRGYAYAKDGDNLETLFETTTKNGLVVSSVCQGNKFSFIIVPEQIQNFKKLAENSTQPQIKEIIPTQTADSSPLTAEEWMLAIGLLEPFGPGNPRPVACLDLNYV